MAWWVIYPNSTSNFGGAPLEELQVFGGVELVFCEVEWNWLRCLGIFHEVEPNLVEQSAPKHPLILRSTPRSCNRVRTEAGLNENFIKSFVASNSISHHQFW